MRLKYYLRGLGVGILMATVVMLIVTSNKAEKITDADVITRATELGMVMKSDTVTETLETNKESAAIAEESKEKVDVNAVENNEENKDTNSGEEINNSLDENNTDETTDDIVAKQISVSITSGMSSEQVSNQLFEAGLIKDSKIFNQFLSENNYAKKIRVGTFSISNDSTEEEIAHIITGN